MKPCLRPAGGRGARKGPTTIKIISSSIFQITQCSLASGLHQAQLPSTAGHHLRPRISGDSLRISSISGEKASWVSRAELTPRAAIQSRARKSLYAASSLHIVLQPSPPKAIFSYSVRGPIQKGPCARPNPVPYACFVAKWSSVQSEWFIPSPRLEVVPPPRNDM